MKVISYKNLPNRFPILFTAVVWLFLDRFDAPDWVWGVVSTIIVFIWIGIIYAISTNTYIDILKGDKK